jgi:cytosine/adenosine deaminase-related metal-dependent hydrolase
MLNEMRVASYMSKVADWDCYSGSARDVFNSATLGGARGLRRPDLGRLAPGALADIAVVDMENLNNVPCRDPVKGLVYNATRGDVTHVMVDGELVIEDGVLLTVDEPSLVKEVQRAAEAIWARIPENHYLGLGGDEVSPQSFRPWDP